jgi:hypothetical protein
MLSINPKKELSVNFNIETVREAIIKIEKSDCPIIKDDLIINEIIFHDKEKFGFGYHVTFNLTKKSDTETMISIEVSRNLSTINNSTELGIANNKLKRFTSELSAYLSGDINPETGRANVIQPSGCVVLLLGFFTATISLLSIVLFKII